MIRVYLAEDSPTVAEVIKQILAQDPQIELVGMAADGVQAMAELPMARPDVLITDLSMPRMNGLELIRRVMEEFPLPILVVSNTAQQQGSTLAFQSLEIGALEVCPKPRGGHHFQESGKHLLNTIRVLAGVKVLRHRKPSHPPEPSIRQEIQVVGIGASTGGPQALLTLFRGIGAGLPAPLLVVQHISEGFLSGFARWLSESTPIPVQVAEDGVRPCPGRAYLAPENRHLEMDKDGVLRLAAGDGTPGSVPSVDRLFFSLAQTMGPSACGVLLTGMGKDGAQGLLAMRKAGSATLAQAESDCLIYGMPKAAADLDAARSILELRLMPGLLRTLCG
jgi:two-component system chemotaxis response regulator CheB